MKKNFTSLLLLLLTLNVTNAQVSEQDSLAIVDLYNSTDGPHWHIKTNWLTTKPLDEWEGIYIGGYGLMISLASNNLTGSIPESLGNISSLKYLFLEFNQLSGNIPESFGNLTNLRICLKTIQHNSYGR